MGLLIYNVFIHAILNLDAFVSLVLNDKVTLPYLKYVQDDETTLMEEEELAKAEPNDAMNEVKAVLAF